MTSSPKFILNQFDIKPLNAQHNLSSFDCSYEEGYLGLNEFIHKEALQYQQSFMGPTYVFFYQNSFVGYVTIAMYAIEVKETRLGITAKEKRYPTLLLGRLAVDNNYRERHAGLCIVQWTVACAEELAKNIGCRFVVVLTVPSKVGFYQKCDFETCPR